MADTDQMQVAAVDAVRALLAVTPARDPEGWWEAQHQAVKPVTTAVQAGVSHRAIAAQAGAPGLMVIDLIADTTARGAALAVERHHAVRYVTLVQEATARYAARAIGDGAASKVELARTLGISRPTLDAWLDILGDDTPTGDAAPVGR